MPKQKLGKIIVALIQRYYPAERLQRLLNAQYSKQKFQIAGEDYATFSKEEIIEMLESADLLYHIKHAADFGVKVSEPSFDFAAVQERRQRVVDQLVGAVPKNQLENMVKKALWKVE